MPAFNSRLRPPEKFGVPVAVFNYGIPAFMSFLFCMFCPLVLRILLIILGIFCLVLAVHGAVNHQNMLFLAAMRSSKREGKAKLPISKQEY